MKKRVLMACICALMLSQYGWADNLEIAPVAIQPGGEATAAITLENQEKVFTSLQFDLTLPEGVTLKYDEDDEDYVYERNTSRMSGNNWSFTISPVGESSTHFRFIIYNNKNATIKETTGTLFSLTLVASESAKKGTVQGHILNQKLAIDENTSDDTEDVAFDIIVPGTEEFTGISVTTATDGAISIDVTDQPHMGQIPETVEEAVLTYTRELTKSGTDDEMYTVCLPYEPPTGEGLKYYTLNAVSGTTLSFEEVASPEAYKPYLVVASGNVGVGIGTGVNADFTTQITATDADGYELCGTLHGMDNETAAAAGAYILQGNGTWGKVKTENTGADIPPFRAYIVSKSGGAARLYSVLEGTTGIDDAMLQDAAEGDWYMLDGRRLADKPAKKGAYIRSGKIEIVK